MGTHRSYSKTFIFIIEDKYKKLTIGITTLLNIDFFNKNAEYIIDIGEKDYWGKGLCIRSLKNYAFEKLNLHRIYLREFTESSNIT